MHQAHARKGYSFNMKIIHTVTFTAVLLLLCFLCMVYIHYLPQENENILHAETKLERSVTRCPPFVEIEIDKDGSVFIGEQNISINKMKEVLKSSFAIKGMDLPVLLHVDKNATISTIKPIIQSLLELGKYRIHFEVRSTINGRFYVFAVMMDKKYFDSNDFIEISNNKLKLNNQLSNVTNIEHYINELSEVNSIKLICDTDTNYQKLIDILSICDQRKLKSIEFIIKKNANEAAPGDHNN